MMDDLTIQRYQRGGDLFAAYEARYGFSHAANIAAAARTGDKYSVGQAIEQAKYGKPLDASTLSQLVGQLTTDPLGAPLESANRAIGNTVFSFLKNPWVLLAVGALAAWKLGLFKRP